MRIAQIIDSLSSGGAERLQVTFAETAMAHQIKPTVIVLANYPNSPVRGQLQDTNVEIVDFMGRNLVDPIRFIRLTLYLRRQNFDILHAHLGYAIILGIAAGLLSGTPVVATLHNVRSDRWNTLEKIMLWLGAKKIIAVGEMVQRAHATELYASRLITIANPVKGVENISQDEKNKIRTQLTGDPKRPLLISVGRLEPQKGYADLITAISQVKKSTPNVFLCIAGTGILHDSISNQIIELGLQENVSLLGIRSDIPQLLAASDFFVSSSHWEGMPIAILEAMSAGLPVIATNVGDVPNILRHAQGIIVNPKKPDELAQAIKSLLNTPKDWVILGNAAKEYVTKNHDVNHWLEQLLDLYARYKRK